MYQRNRITALNTDERDVIIDWADGHRSRFPRIWLRHNCRCERCGDTESAVRHLKFTDLPERPDIAELTAQDKELLVRWRDGHHSRYDPVWLRAHCLSDEARESRRFKPRLWGPGTLDQLPYMDYGGVTRDEELHLRLLEDLLAFGFVILTGVPASRQKTNSITDLIGVLRMTNYGIYELESKPNPELVGDTAMALPPHTDEPYRHHPPGITFFHVIEQSAEGGESTLLDGFRVARELEHDEPQAFEILASTAVGFHRTLAEGRSFYAEAPIIRLDRNGDVAGLRILDRGMAPLDLPADKVESFYGALRSLFNRLYDDGEILKVRLNSGEMLIFNNQRLLHGRLAFDPNSSRRHVRTCNVDLDEFYSKLRVLYRKHNRDAAWTRFPQGANV